MDRKVAILGSELFQGKTSPSLVSEVDPLKCLWLTARNNISKARYVNMRLALLKHVKLAPYSFLRELRMAITPQLHTWPLNCAPEEQRGVYAELGEAIRIVVQRMIQFGSGEWMPCCNHEGNSCSNLVGLADNCQILAVRSDICKIGQLSDRTTVSADNCQIRQLSDRTTVRSDNCQIGQLSVGQLSVGHGQLSEKTVSALKKL